MPKIKVDTKEFDELLLDVLFQSCGKDNEIDNMCISAYEDACAYLTEKGYFTTKNGRIYKLKELKDFPKSEHDAPSDEEQIKKELDKDYE